MRQGAVLAITCLALATVVAAMASLNVALPDIARHTHADQTQQTWIIDAYSLVFASLLLPAGALGDRFGRRRALIVGLVIYGAGSVLAALATDPNVLIGLRALLGLGAALIMPATLSTITSSFPRDQRARAVSVWAAVAGGSGVLGLLASGLLLEWWSWESVFWFNVLLASVALAGTLVFVPESAESRPAPLDVVGAVLAAAGIGALVYAVIEAPVNGWSDPLTVGGSALGLLVLGGFVAFELRRRHPLLDPRLFRNRRFAAGSLSLTLQFFALFGFMFVIMQYLQLVRGYSALSAALSLLAMPLGMIPTSRLSPLLTQRLGVRGPWVAGLLMLGAGLAVLSHLDGASTYGNLAAGLIPLGAGLGLAMPPATTAITDALPKELQNVGSAVNDLARELGGALGIAVLGSLLTAAYRNDLHLTGVPPQVAEAAESSLAGAAAAGGTVLHQAQAAFTTGLHIALLGAAITAVVTAVAVAVLLRRSPVGRTQDAVSLDPVAHGGQQRPE
ncbi:MFS transporter [Streptomyces sp. HUAS TT20]|uniref:MFS transporter n=1 Tax=Streptomyces sp. HUAS TT20 TaxID=3447509 RepID=UPI0021DB4C9D|nr:MFS transporter [Streptomyces sp. HUAS 15-9]UXY30699.1 MFS transporter [Streptomyces sp. HUAS 15-9]